MFELKKAGDSTWYVQAPAKIGIVQTGGEDIILIDSGNDQSAGRKIRQILEKNGWNLKAIYSTHSHADHIGGNRYLQSQSGCPIYAPGMERDFSAHPVLEPSLLYGGYPFKDLRHKFLMARESDVRALEESDLPEGFEIIPLPGHSMDMVGYRTPDNIVFLADCLSSRETLEKYQISFIYDVAAYLETLEMIQHLEADLFIPSHAAPAKDIRELAQVNIDKVHEIADAILEICRNEQTFEEILRALFERYGLRMDYEQYVLVGSTIRSYLSWLKDTGRIEGLIRDNRLLWKTVD